MSKFFVITTILIMLKILQASENTTQLPMQGKLIGIQKAPYVAAIYELEFYKCTGSYISNLWVLTSGYCIVGKLVRDLTVVMGTNEVNRIGDKKDVVMLVLHPNYTAVPLQNDVGLIGVASPFSTGSAIRPITISDKTVSITEFCSLIGWGSAINFTHQLFGNESILLRQVRMKPIKQETCRGMLPNVTARYGKEFISDSVICARGEDGDACLGDVGAPLVCDQVQVGITSMVFEECGKRKPSVYTDVAKYRQWISGKTMPIMISPKLGSYSLHSSSWFVIFRMCVLVILSVML